MMEMNEDKGDEKKMLEMKKGSWEMSGDNGDEWKMSGDDGDEWR